jgi:predicted transcriptional regulator of viral defense system
MTLKVITLYFEQISKEVKQVNREANIITIDNIEDLLGLIYNKKTIILPSKTKSILLLV